MVSESARATTAKEAGYRIDYPNSRPRSAKLVALDEKSGPMVQRLARANRHRSVLLGASSPPGPQAHADGTVSSLKHWLSDFSGRIKALLPALDPAGPGVLCATPAPDPPPAPA